MKKIIRLTESDLMKIVKRVIEEQTPLKPQTGGSPDSLKSLVGKSVNLYSDAQNTKFVKTFVIERVEKSRNPKLLNIYEKGQDPGQPTLWYEYDKKSFLGSDRKYYYNNQLGSILQKEIEKGFTKNPQGVTVPKADFASTGTNQQSNIA